MKMDLNRGIHVGRNIALFRDARGLSPSELARLLEERRNGAISEQMIIDIEKQETIDNEEILRAIADALGVRVEVLKNLDLSNSVSFVANTINYHETDYSQAMVNQFNQGSTFNQKNKNPMDKIPKMV